MSYGKPIRLWCWLPYTTTSTCLWQDDLIRKVSVEGMPDRYDRIQRHDHLVCRRCGKLSDIDLGDLTAELEKKAGISILSYDLKLNYLCEECRKEIQEKGM